MHIHVAEPRLASCRSAARVLSRRRAGAQAHPGQSVRSAAGADRGHSRGAARRAAAAGAALFEVIASRAARPCAGRRRSHATPGSRPRCSRPSPAASATWCGDGGRAHRRPAHQAGHHALVAHHDAGRGLRRGRCRRGRSVRGDGLAARAPGRDPEEARRAPSAARAAWCSTTCRRATSRAPPARWPSCGYNRDGKTRHAAGQLRPAHRCARLPGGGVGVRGQCRRQPDLAARGQAAARGLRHRAAGDGGRPRHDLAARPSTSCARPTASAGSRRSRARRSARWSSRGSCSWACSTSATCSSSARRTIRASGWWRAAIRSWPSCARTSARSCWRPPSATSTRSRPGWTRASSTGSDAIGVRVGKVVNQYKVAKHFELDHRRQRASASQRKHDSIAAEAALDGIYIIRTSVPAAQMDAADCVRNYKSLANVERAFRSLKTIDLKVRPIHHRTADRVRAHIFLCMLAYYVEWHMREAWRELMFADTDQAGQGHARSRGAGQALRSGAGQGRPPHARRRHARAQLLHPARRTRHHRAQHLPHAHTPGPMRRPSRSSPRPTPSNSARSNCSSRSSCRQKPEPRSHAKCLSCNDKLARRPEELQSSVWTFSAVAGTPARSKGTAAPSASTRYTNFPPGSSWFE